MASIIPDYEFDIFISYRHKDDKYDHWVTEFVSNLKHELETTSRYQLNIYFDVNPVDGLLENHDVDDSLKEKLRCLVFIPVISHTYCDETSFAWAHEFRSFVNQASADRYGVKIKLPNGNYASRVLPVIIHDLSSDEILLCERIIGGQLRGIDFVYREPGVNRPLRSNEDNARDHTSYRNQINKVANAIKEIASAMTINYPSLVTTTRELAGKESAPIPKKSFTKKWMVFAGFIIFLMIASGLISVLSLRPTGKELEKSIAVLPFTSDSQDEQDLLMTNGLMEEILLSLQSIKNLRVISRSSVEQYRGDQRPSSPEISKTLGVNYLVEGSIQKSGNSLMLRVELIRAAGKEANIWGKSFQLNLNEIDIDDIFSLQSKIAETIVKEMDVVITPEERNVIEEVPTKNMEAYGYFLQAREAAMHYTTDPDFLDTDPLKIARINFRKTLALDSTFSQAYSGLALCYYFDNMAFDLSAEEIPVDSLLLLIDKSLKYDEHNPEAYLVKSLYYAFTGESEKAFKECDLALKYNPNYWEAYQFRGNFLYRFNFRKGNFVRALENMKTAITLNSGNNLSYLFSELGSTIGGFGGFHNEAEIFYRKAFDISNDSAIYYMNLAYNEIDKDNVEKAIGYNEIANRIDSTSYDGMITIAQSYIHTGNYDEALIYFRKVIRHFEKTGNISKGLLHRIAFAYWQTGDREKARYWFKKSIEMNERSIKNQDWNARVGYTVYYDLAGVYAFLGDKKKALDNLKLFNRVDICPKWLIALIKRDPMFEKIRDDQEFRNIVADLEKKFQSEHEMIAKWLAANLELLQ